MTVLPRRSSLNNFMSILGKHLILLLFILFIFGCVSKAKVHVYAKYLSEHEKQSVSQKIEELGFIAVFNEFGFPTNITDSSIIYSPLLRESNSVELLELVPLQSHQLAGDCRFAFGMRLLPIL